MSSIYFKYENIAACLKIVEENKNTVGSGNKKTLKTIPAV